MKKKLRAYLWEECEDSETAVGVIASNIREAKKLARDFWASEAGLDRDYIENTIKWKKDVDTTGLEKGVVDGLVGLKIGLYSVLFYWDCPCCNTEDTSVYYDKYSKLFYCENCEENVTGVK